jgi:hypothetical protein
MQSTFDVLTAAHQDKLVDVVDHDAPADRGSRR